MSLQESFNHKEAAIISRLLEKQTGINDRTGKGTATEVIVQEELLDPFLPPGFECGKGAVVSAEAPDKQSPAIDRIVIDTSASMPLVHDAAHAIFPIESVAGLVEITMHLDATKLKEDIERMVPAKAMKTRRYLAPAPGSTTKVMAVDDRDALSPRSFIVGLPAHRNWSAKTIAQNLRDIQVDMGNPTHVHGLYVLGVGYFWTKPIEGHSETSYKVGAWIGPERLFRFAVSFRTAFDRWPRLKTGWSVDLGGYGNDSSTSFDAE
jgi:hypothetical protein